jgi:hypothetical protein
MRGAETFRILRHTALKRLMCASAIVASLSGVTFPTTVSFAATGTGAQPDADKVAPQPGAVKNQVQQAFESPAANSNSAETPKNPLTGTPAKPAETKPSQIDPAQKNTNSPSPDDAAAIIDAPSGEIIRDMSKLPAPVRQMREKIIEAAASGIIERLRPLVNIGPNQTLIMNADSDDPVEMLKSFSGDPDGQEIMAIFLDLLSTGAVRLDAGKPDEVYVWPYFAGKPLSTLTPPERVELLRIVTAGDLLGMEETGTYNFYRLGISPDGQWKFVAGGE